MRILDRARVLRTDVPARREPWLGIGALVIYFSLQAWGASEPSGTAGAEPALRLQIAQDGSGFIWWGQERLAGLAEIRARAEGIAVKGMKLSWGADAGALRVRSSMRALSIVADGFEGWSATLPIETEVGIGVFNAALTLTTPPNNQQPVELRFSDGATASLGAGSRARMDLFQDQSYALSGRGQVHGVNADGKRTTLSASMPPMTGGPLVPVTDAQGNKFVQRRAPTLLITISGEPGGELGVQVADQIIQLDTPQPRTISFANGSTLRLERERETGYLRWEVVQGDFRFSINGVSGWRGCGESGQSAAITWDREKKAVDLFNRCGESVAVALPSHTFAQVTPRATFQFVQLATDTFATAANGGPVSLYNALTGQQTDLSQGNLLFRSGLAVRPRPSTAAENTVALQWQSGGGVTVNSSAEGAVQVQRRESRVIPGAGDSQLLLQLPEDGQLMLRALSGQHSVQLSTLRNLCIRLPEGNGLVCSVDPRLGAFTGRALAENSAPVEIVTPGGTIPLLYSDQTVMLLGGQSGLGAPLSSAAIFSESQDLGNNTPVAPTVPAGSPTADADVFRRFNNEISGSRIEQPPVSVIK